MIEHPSLHPDIEEQLSWLGQELSGEDDRLTAKIEKLGNLGIGRLIQTKHPDNPHDRKTIGISLPVGDEVFSHMLAFTNGFIGRFEPDISFKDSKIHHGKLFSPNPKPIHIEEFWGISAAEVSRNARMNPDRFFSKITHSNFNPDQQYEVEELFSTALENAFIVKEQDDDGKKHGVVFLNRELTVFEDRMNKKKRN